MIEFLKEHFKHWLTMVGILTLIGIVADIYIFFAYIKAADDILIGLFLAVNVFAIVLITSVVSTIVEFTALAGLAWEKLKDLQ